MARAAKAAELTAAIYARYSSHNQKEESIEQQLDECRAYALANHYRVVAEYTDSAISGKSDNRPGYQRMLRNAERGQFQVLIAYKSNRIARNMLNALACEERMSRYGVRIVYAKEEFGDTAAGRFALRTMMNVNQFYSENMAEDIQRGLYDNAEKCLLNIRPPYGYRKGADGRHEIVEAEAEIVREIFRRAAAGEKQCDIYNDLNARGLTTHNGGPWGRSSFHRMFASECYIGTYVYGDVRKEGVIPPIVDKEVYYAVQNRMQSRKQTRGRATPGGDYLLTGKLFCGDCREPMTGVSGTSKHGILYYYYVCRGKRARSGCKMPPIRREYAEMFVADAVRTYILQDDVISWIADTVMTYRKRHESRAALDDISAKLAEVNRGIRNMLNAIEQGIITSSTKERLEALEAQKASLEARAAGERMRLPSVTRDQIVFWLDSFRSGDVRDKQFQAMLFDTFLVAAYLYADKVELVFNYTGDQTMATVDFAELEAELIDDLTQCSSDSPKVDFRRLNANPTAYLYMACGLFVLVAPRTGAKAPA